ncbi:TIGR03618 family F420-dependent PPOX class oxidoreductase [Spiractinospora alimapuensis]|nr:TIGR03618 family F420-dependent PPOX class oxidoreductase [Spiractinospora alimapuensis]
MDIPTAQAFLNDHSHAVLGTYRSDGRIQMSPVLVGVDAEGRAIVSTRHTAMKTHNLRRDPRAVLCVLSDGFFGDWVQVEGEAEVVDLPEALPLLVDYYRRVSGEHDDWAEYEESMRRERRVLVRVTITAAGPSVSG